MKEKYITGFIQTQAGKIPLVNTQMTLTDFWGTLKVRWSINRDNYRVLPGLYGIGAPTESSDVFVTANYKLSFDHVRKNIDGLNAWILVLDTKGVNVWCAAGKGTFSTKELVNRIKITQLDKIINHKRIIVPQLGATGISAHKVKKETEMQVTGILEPVTKNNFTNSLNVDGLYFKNNTGFNVIYGPVKASDIKKFIHSGYKATREMRKVTFNFTDRIKLIPVDFVYGKKYILTGLALLFVLSGINRSGISFEKAFNEGTYAMMNLFLAYIAGIVFTPMLLPYIPGRPFALKGFITGFFLAAILMFLKKTGDSGLENISWFLIITSLSSFLAMNFTGSSTYTSLSGVKKEMKIALPIQITLVSLGIILFTIGKIV
jgi:hypothetical protein